MFKHLQCSLNMKISTETVCNLLWDSPIKWLNTSMIAERTPKQQMCPDKPNDSYLHSKHPTFQVVHKALVVLASDLSQNGEENEEYGGFHDKFRWEKLSGTPQIKSTLRTLRGWCAAAGYGDFLPCNKRVFSEAEGTSNRDFQGFKFAGWNVFTNTEGGAMWTLSVLKRDWNTVP